MILVFVNYLPCMMSSYPLPFTRNECYNLFLSLFSYVFLKLYFQSNLIFGIKKKRNKKKFIERNKKKERTRLRRVGTKK